jgi:hypothetical protein
MGQWGKQRHFLTEGGYRLSVIAHTSEPSVWTPLHGSHTIDSLIIIHHGGGDAMDKFKELEREWIGRPHSEWAA